MSVWVDYYKIFIPQDIHAISRDADFLTKSPTDKGSVVRFASALGGRAVYPNIRSLTALVGQAVREISKEEYLNVDVIWNVLGVKQKEIIDRAVKFEVDGLEYLVMHPLHVFKSRITNLYKVPEKQDEKGIYQLRLAIDVAREFLRDEASRLWKEEGPEKSQRVIQRHISSIEKEAFNARGRKIAKRYGVHIADAIDPNLITSPTFWEKKWPILKGAMSASYAVKFDAPKPIQPVVKKSSGFRRV